MATQATAEITIARPLADVHALLDDITAHERFLDHFMTDFELLSPSPRGVGARIRAKAKGSGTVEVEVKEADAHRIMEESTGGKGGRRRARGTYTFAEAEGGTRVRFTMDLLEGNAIDRLTWPLGAKLMGSWTQKGLERLKVQMEGER